MNKKVLAVTAAVLVGTSASMFADNIGPGLGRVLLKGKSGKLWEFVGTTLNGLGGNGMFAITFGTSGYEKGAEIALVDTNNFIAENMDQLANDIAMGDGEYLDVLSDMLAVSDKAAFKNTLQANFNDIYSSSDVTSEEVSAKIYALVG